MENQNVNIIPMPIVPEESWRRTDPEIFFLPETEVLDASGARSSTKFSNWKIIEHPMSVENLELKLNALFSTSYPDLVEWIRTENLWNRIHIATIRNGTAEYFHSADSAKAVLIAAKDFAPLAILEHSKISQATSQRLAFSAGQEIEVSVSNSVPDPIIILESGSSDVQQAYAAIKIIGKASAKFSLIMLERSSPFALLRHQLVLEDNAKVVQLWAHSDIGANKNSKILSERIVQIANNCEFFDAQIFAPKGTFRCISNVISNGEGSQSKSGAAVVATENSRLDYEPWQEHRISKSHSELKAKYLVTDTAKAVFQGLIRVEREAAKTKALQENKNLLIGKRSRVDAQPRLEILPNDVMCKHGSATGQIDSKHVYYLSSRGFSESEAKALIVRGFVHDGLSSIPHDHPLQSLATNMLSRILANVSFSDPC